MNHDWSAEKFKNGLLMSYRHNEEDNLELKLHFSYKGSFSQRANSTVIDARVVAQGLLEDVKEMKTWIGEQGEIPVTISGETKTMFLIRVLKECGFEVKKPENEFDEWKFRVSTEGLNIDELFSNVEASIVKVLELATNLEGKRSLRHNSNRKES